MAQKLFLPLLPDSLTQKKKKAIHTSSDLARKGVGGNCNYQGREKRGDYFRTMIPTANSNEGGSIVSG
jgi:hypothetical protein